MLVAFDYALYLGLSCLVVRISKWIHNPLALEVRSMIMHYIGMVYVLSCLVQKEFFLDVWIFVVGLLSMQFVFLAFNLCMLINLLSYV
jgi:hypothetical protein